MEELKISIADLYGKSIALKRYVDAYCTKHCISVDVALTHKIVQRYSESIMEDIRKREEIDDTDNSRED